MTRSYAQIVTAIWRDDEFRALTVAEQHLYLLLTTQPDISAAGVLHLAVTRWAGRASDTKPADIIRTLDGLAARRFVVVDPDTEEVLVRSFIRWDKGFTNPKRQPAIRDAINAIESATLLAAVAAEVGRIDMPMAFRGLAASLPDRAPDSLSTPDGWADVTTMPIPTPDLASPQVDSLSNAYPMATDSVSPSERRVPQPATHNPQPTTQSQNLSPLASLDGANDSDTIIETRPGTQLALVGDVSPPKSRRGTRLAADWVPAADLRRWALDSLPGYDTRAEHANFVDYWISTPGAKGVKLDWDATWRTWMRRAAERSGWRPGGPMVARSGDRPSTTDNRIASTLGLIADMTPGDADQ